MGELKVYKTVANRLKCLQGENRSKSSEQYSYFPYNETYAPTSWPKVRVSGIDIKGKEVVLVSMALTLLVTSLCLFYKNWKKNYRDINQLPYYSYMYKVQSPSPTVARAVPSKTPVMHWAKAAATIGAGLKFSELKNKPDMINKLDPPATETKPIHDIPISQTCLPPSGVTTARATLSQNSIPSASVHINRRLQAKLQRIRARAALEMEKEAAVSNNNPDLHLDDASLKQKSLECMTHAQSNNRAIPFVSKSNRAQSDIHLKMKRWHVRTNRHSSMMRYTGTQSNANLLNTRKITSNSFEVAPSLIPKDLPKSIPTSRSMTQSTDWGVCYSWNKGVDTTSMIRKTRLRSLQPLCEKDQYGFISSSHYMGKNQNDAASEQIDKVTHDKGRYYECIADATSVATSREFCPNDMIRNRSQKLKNEPEVFLKESSHSLREDGCNNDDINNEKDEHVIRNGTINLYENNIFENEEFNMQKRNEDTGTKCTKENEDSSNERSMKHKRVLLPTDSLSMHGSSHTSTEV